MRNIRDACRRGSGPQQRHRQQIHHALGRVTIAVDDLIKQIVGIGPTADRRHPAVQVHPLLAVGDVRLSDIRRHRQVRRTDRLLLSLLALLFQDGILQQLQVHIVTHGHHMAGLLRAQEIARAADL